MVVIIHQTLQFKEGYAMTTRWKTCVAVIRTLATHRVTYRFLGLFLVSLGVLKAFRWSKALGMSSAFYLVVVLSDLAEAKMSLE